MTKQPINKKKILHILHIIYDILSALFIVLVSGALIINACRSDEKAKDVLTPNIQEVYKTRKNVIVGESRKVSYSNEFLSNNFLTTIVYASGLTDSYINDPQANTKTIYVGEGYIDSYTPSYPRVTAWNNINFDNFTANGSEDVKWSYLSNIYMQVVDSGVGVNGAKFIAIGFHFRDDLEDDIFHFTCNLFYIGASPFTDNSSLSFTTNSVVVDKSFVTPNFGVIYSKNSALDTYLNAMNDDSYHKGYEIGKQEGYNIGYVEGSRGIESNAFTVIGQAFEAVSNIFSIEVLPSLPLWILVFTPLIIAVVIVVVKLIKG